NSLGVFYHQKQESAKAIQTLEEALKYDPDNTDIRVNLSMMLLEQQQFQKVIERLGSGSELNNNDQRTVTALAVSYFALGKYDQAVVFYGKLSQLMPEDQ